MQSFKGKRDSQRISDCFSKTLFWVLLLVGVTSFCFSAHLVWAAGQGNQEFLAIAYHDVVESREQLRSDSVTLETLVNHFEWLVLNGYHPVSVNDLIAAREKETKLPAKPVLLCWDDSYKSFYRYVFPLLRAYKFPAVLAVVGSWKEVDGDGKVQYGDNLVSGDIFMSWQQIREVAESGLVEIASHSMDLHSPRLADRYGDLLPAIITHVYDSETDEHETDEQMRSRVQDDLKANNDLIGKKIGRKVRVMVWPYGRYNQLAIDIAKSLDMSLSLTLDPIPGRVDALDVVGRKYPTLNLETRSFRDSLQFRNDPGPKRFLRVAPEELLEDLGKEERFGRFLERMKELKPGSVILEPVIKSERGLEALFTNGIYTVKQDRLTRLIWHTSRRAEVGVNLWLRKELFQGENSAQLFYEMGKQAPASGFIVEYPEFAESISRYGDKVEHAEIIREWNPQLTRKNRQAARTDSTLDLLSSSVLESLEAYQYWQPFQEAGVTVSAAMLRTLTADQLFSFFRYFDYLYITGVDEPGLQGDIINSDVQSELSPIDLRKIVIIMECSTEKGQLCSNIEETTSSLQQQGFISWGYQYDRFLDGLPELEMIRPFISARSYPFIAR